MHFANSPPPRAADGLTPAASALDCVGCSNTQSSTNECGADILRPSAAHRNRFANAHGPMNPRIYARRARNLA
ncbi:hypothetical protein EVAR_81547_1 [Eumeta japonica]|uniref:Uncharacterized protein n=1 Tax=Eumeta variegata TaxID=151549 RepID=A0A4C1UZ92_EUMVA|nr:hypothetical protein EVAR_81547_1 [Eumeta japonica]